MEKSALEAYLNTLDIWLLIFGILVAVGTVGGTVAGVLRWTKSNELQALQASENLELHRQLDQAKNDAAEAGRKVSGIEEKAAPRHLTDDQRSEILSALSGIAGQKFDIISIMNDDESSRFAHEIDAALKNSKWDDDGQLIQSTFAPNNPIGITLQINSKDATVGNIPAGIPVLVDTFFRLGLMANRNVFPHAQSRPGRITIVVGKKA